MFRISFVCLGRYLKRVLPLCKRAEGVGLIVDVIGVSSGFVSVFVLIHLDTHLLVEREV